MTMATINSSKLFPLSLLTFAVTAATVETVIVAAADADCYLTANGAFDRAY